VLIVFALAGCWAAHALVPIGEESYLEQVVLSELSAANAPGSARGFQPAAAGSSFTG
jgi:hypothetical protein